VKRMLPFLTILFWLAAPPVRSLPRNGLDDYIIQGLRGNLAFRQENLSLEKSLQALKEAKGLFFPNVSIQARYSRAGGGRLIEIPIGDLTNPIFQSINQLYSFHGIITNFPTDMPNEVFPFLRKSEHETKLRLIQPLIQPALIQNYRLRSHMAKSEEAKLAVLKRQLIADIRTAYFNHIKSLQVEALLEKTMALLEENLRVSRTLFKGGKATEDVIFRARAELADLEQKIAEAEKNRHLSAGYFNFLLNRDLDETITTDYTPPQEMEAIEWEAAAESALRHRDEFRQLDNAMKATNSQIGLAGSGALPSLSLVVDVGFQGEKYALGPEDDFWMASLVFQWNLYDGGLTKAKKAQAAVAKKSLEIQRDQLEKQILLQVKDAYHALNSAGEAVRAAEERERSARESFVIVEKKYGYGTAPQIEFIDARTTYTGASVNTILARFDYLISRTALERAAALIDLEKYQ
jgi:outer membrane protein